MVLHLFICLFPSIKIFNRVEALETWLTVTSSSTPLPSLGNMAELQTAINDVQMDWKTDGLYLCVFTDKTVQVLLADCISVSSQIRQSSSASILSFLQCSRTTF